MFNAPKRNNLPCSKPLAAALYAVSRAHLIGVVSVSGKHENEAHERKILHKALQKIRLNRHKKANKTS